jgi:hypothetical protein
MILRTFLTNSVPQFILSRIHLGAKVDTQAVHAIRFMRFMRAMPDYDWLQHVRFRLSVD